MTLISLYWFLTSKSSEGQCDGMKMSFPLYHRWQTQGPQAESGPPPCSIRPAPCFYPAAALSSLPLVKGSYMYTVLKLHSALWRQPRGWCGPQRKWVWHPVYTKGIHLLASLGHTGRKRLVLGHTLNTHTLIKTDEQKKDPCIILWYLSTKISKKALTY